MSNHYSYIVDWALFSAGIFSTLVLLKSMLHFSRTGPQIKDEIRQHYSLYTAYALARLYFFCFVSLFIIALPGTSLFAVFIADEPHPPLWVKALCGPLAGLISIGLICTRQFIHYLYYNPGLIITSLNFNPVRLNPLFNQLTKTRLFLVDGLLLGSYLSAHMYLLIQASTQHGLVFTLGLNIIPLLYIAIAIWALAKIRKERSAPRKQQKQTHQPNILMIGSDTLRTDHLSASGYHRNTTPFIDGLAKKGLFFQNCFVPIARTAPSLASLFTGCWPNTHKIKTNYCSQQQVNAMSTPGLATLLAKHGYLTSVISDWAGSDFGKFDFGFQRKNVPEDQWNLKYLIRQGPKDIRLLLSLFCHNPLGKRFLPELYYLAGIPLTQQLGKDTCREIDFLASKNQPFFLNVFMGTTHPPFASNYPFYSEYADADYAGRSRFCMSRLTTPEEIIESQQEPKEAFDLDQVIALYDGSICQFDNEVEKIITHLDQAALRDDTIVVIYSDHGIDFFEGDTWGQGNSIASDASAKTPFIIHAPGMTENKTISAKIRNIDILPTLLELVEIDIPDTIDGTSLAPIMQGNDAPVDLPIIFETGLWLAPPPRQRKHHLIYPDIFHLIEVPDKRAGTLALKEEYSSAIENARDWFVWVDSWLLKCYPLESGPEYELYNTKDDLSCKNNIACQHQGVVRDMAKLKVTAQTSNSVL